MSEEGRLVGTVKVCYNLNLTTAGLLIHMAERKAITKVMIEMNKAIIVFAGKRHLFQIYLKKGKKQFNLNNN